MKNGRLKISYFLKSAWKLICQKGLNCPSCGASESTMISKKYLVMSLMRCNSCKLFFRTPTTSPEENKAFYQRTYEQGFTTEMPSLDELSKLKGNKFKGTEKSFKNYVNVLNALDINHNLKILDFGCSWGYGSWQLLQAGFEVQAFEISQPRCEYAIKHMDVDATNDIDHLRGPFDVFFSSHVLEHVPSVRQVIALAEMLLKPNGYFVAFTPNGSESYRNGHPTSWKNAWSIVHPNLLDEQYYKNAFAKHSFIIDSNPFDKRAITTWTQMAGCGLKQEVLSLSGNELLFIAKFSNM